MRASNPIDIDQLRLLGERSFRGSYIPSVASKMLRQAANELDELRFGPEGSDQDAAVIVLRLLEMAHVVARNVNFVPSHMGYLTRNAASEIERLRPV